MFEMHILGLVGVPSVTEILADSPSMTNSFLGEASTNQSGLSPSKKYPWKEAFLQRVTRIHETVNKRKSTKKRGWYTKEAMERKLNWSKSLGYITDANQLCVKQSCSLGYTMFLNDSIHQFVS